MVKIWEGDVKSCGLYQKTVTEKKSMGLRIFIDREKQLFITQFLYYEKMDMKTNQKIIADKGDEAI